MWPQFLSSLILECINLKHSCPSCNSELHSGSELVENRVVQDVVSSVQAAAANADKRYTRLLVGVAGISSSLVKDDGSLQLSPVEEIFVEHMSEALSGYQAYLEHLRKARHREEGA
eukprot:CAMPEP_0206365174 /NCGR_PEP_ID=MMETSP0294-20121207/2683_1 /ASSEMBLY_ACC=CAM_ASM_000327 /TAXON_ID=39354 /ORGANISM="Heterosigma akashiwo, Strain CCMP2393" /LENGTH=115 /DNA_ID=CAMNT_0053810965 /DNA_START=94 /DNA_END=439 /DNA_ORIENTATION=-